MYPFKKHVPQRDTSLRGVVNLSVVHYMLRERKPTPFRVGMNLPQLSSML